MNVVSFETAVKLKEAGFPQPEFEVGQFWYADTAYKGGELEHVPLCVLVEAYSTREKFLRRLTCEKMTGEHGVMPQFFAPTTTDILREIDVKVFIGCDIFHTWSVFEFRIGEIEQYLSQHENPAEAAALAWMYLQSKKSA